VGVSDLDPQRLRNVQMRYPDIFATTDYRDLLQNPDIDAIAISTPVATHFDLAMEALRAGKHTWIEKPITRTASEAERLIEEAERRTLALHVDHTFVYTGAVRKIHELIHSGSLGEVFYYDSVRVNLGLFQHDVNVVWDLAVHDLAILDYLLESRAVAVSATGASHVAAQPENIAFLTLFFESKLIAHFHVNWLSPVKVRRTLIGASQKMIVYDDLDAAEKIKVYDKGLKLTPGVAPELVHNMLVGYRTGDMWCPKIDMSEALQTEARHFVDCVVGGSSSLTDGLAGLRVVKILEAACTSLAERGRPVEIASTPVAVCRGGEPATGN
jgi:predicted dehydrogenase